MDLTTLEPIVLKNFLSEENIASIYKTVNAAMDKSREENDGDPYLGEMNKLGNNGFVVFFDNFEPEVRNAVKKGFEDAIGHEIEDPGILFCRYTVDSGAHPRLLPHADRAMPYPAVTCTVELETSLDWDIYVEDYKFNLERNDILIFSGSHTGHWRPDIEFGPNDYFDILLCQSVLKKDGQEKLTEGFFEYMDKHSGELIDKYRHLLTKSLEREDHRQ